MSFKQKFATAIAAGFAVVSFSAFASAQTDNGARPSQDSTERRERRERRGGFGKHHDGEGRGGHRRGGGMGMRELAQLNLTDAQRQQIRAIMESNRGAEKNQQNFDEIRTLMQAKRDGTITAEQQERLKSFKQERRRKAEATRQQVLAVLTAEQRAQLEQIKQQRREQKRERREMRQNEQPNDAKKDGARKDN